MRGSGRCAGTSTSERCLSPGPPSAAFSIRSKTPYRQPSNRTSSNEAPARDTSEGHKDACTRCLTDKSAIAEHAWANHHPINWAETKVLQRANRTMELVMKEALSIRTTPEDACFHIDSGYELPDCWIATFQKLKGTTSLSSAR